MSSQTALHATRHGLFRPLHNIDFRLLVSSNTFWWTTSFMETLLFGWLVLERTNSPWMVALVGFCRSRPFLLFGLWGGTAADRFGRRRVIVVAQSINLLVYLALAYAIQSKALGGITKPMDRKLRELASGKTGPVPGTRYTRTWQDKIHIVTVTADDKFSWQGREYNSLSNVACAITGTHWSGPAFFGTRARRTS